MRSIDEAFRAIDEPKLGQIWKKYTQPGDHVLFVGAGDMVESHAGLALGGVHVDTTALMDTPIECGLYVGMHDVVASYLERNKNGTVDIRFFTEDIQNLPHENGGTRYDTIVLPLVLDEVRNDRIRPQLIRALFALSRPEECLWCATAFIYGYMEQTIEPDMEQIAQELGWEWHPAGKEKFKDHDYDMNRYYVWKSGQP
jgi:hypothetical protein